MPAEAHLPDLCIREVRVMAFGTLGHSVRKKSLNRSKLTLLNIFISQRSVWFISFLSIVPCFVWI